MRCCYRGLVRWTADHESGDRQAALQRAAEQLSDEFAGLFDAEIVGRTLASSYERLTASASEQLPLLAQRFARERLIAMAKTRGHAILTGPAVLFVCTHNAGRSQMALGFFSRLVGDRAFAWSGGSKPDAVVNSLVAQVMSERGIDITGEFPKPWTSELMHAADVVIDMGCGDTDPLMSGHRYEQWPLPDPAGQGIEQVRAIRDAIEMRVHRLAASLGLHPQQGNSARAG